MKFPTDVPFYARTEDWKIFRVYGYHPGQAIRYSAELLDDVNQSSAYLGFDEKGACGSYNWVAYSNEKETLKEQSCKMQSFKTGAVRGTSFDETIRFDLVTPHGIRRVAEAAAEGCLKYGAGNFLKGLPKANLLNHALNHIFNYILGDKSEDHLGHACWNLMAIMHFEETQRTDLDEELIFQHE